MCVRHLIQQGHRRIGIINGSSTLQTSKQRLAGYLAALREAQIEVDPGLIKEETFAKPADTGWERSFYLPIAGPLRFLFRMA